MKNGSVFPTPTMNAVDVHRKVKLNRHILNNWYEYLFSVLNACIGLGNFMIFPAKAYEYRGGAFLVAYSFMILLLGWPVLYLELIIGQYHRCSPIIFIRRCIPILQGLGWFSVLSAFFTVLFYQYSVARSFKFLVSLAQSHSEKMPWSTCGNSWNTDDCYQFFNETCPTPKKAHIFYNNRCVNASSLVADSLESAEEQYLQSKIHKIGPSHTSFASFNSGMFYALMIVWILIAFIQNKRSKSQILIYVPTLFVFTICPFLLARSLHLVGALEGVKELFSVEWADLMYTGIWLDATSLVISSLTLGTGIHTVLASFAPPLKATFRVATIAVLTDSVLNLMVTTTLFSILGYIKLTIGVDSVYEIPLIPKDILLTHSAFPILLRRVAQNAWMWIFLYYSVLVLVGWKSCALVFKSITVTIADVWNFATDTFRFDVFSVFFAAMMPFFGGFLLCFDGGPRYLPMLLNVRKFVTGLSIATELIVVVDFYTLETFYQDILHLMGRPSRKQWIRAYTWNVWKWRWRMAPAFGIVSAVYSLVAVFPSAENDLVYSGLYSTIHILILVSITLLPFFIGCWTVPQQKMHFDLKEMKAFQWSSLLSRQRHLRSWLRIKKKVPHEIVESLTSTEPEDPNGFWFEVYRPYFRMVRTSDGTKKRKYPKEQQEDATQKVIKRNFTPRFETYGEYDNNAWENGFMKKVNKEEKKEEKKEDVAGEKKKEEKEKSPKKQESRKKKESKTAKESNKKKSTKAKSKEKKKKTKQ